MLAIDTNIIVRLLTRDDAAQAARARALIEDNDVFVGDTVMLETEWVLRAVYGFSPEAVVRALRAFAGMARVTLENPDIIAAALSHAEAGLDFADALHLASSGGATRFATFDGKLVRRARGAAKIEVVAA